MNMPLKQSNLNMPMNSNIKYDQTQTLNRMIRLRLMNNLRLRLMNNLKLMNLRLRLMNNLKIMQAQSQSFEYAQDSHKLRFSRLNDLMSPKRKLKLTNRVMKLKITLKLRLMSNHKVLTVNHLIKYKKFLRHTVTLLTRLMILLIHPTIPSSNRNRQSIIITMKLPAILTDSIKMSINTTITIPIPVSTLITLLLKPSTPTLGGV